MSNYSSESFKKWVEGLAEDGAIDKEQRSIIAGLRLDVEQEINDEIQLLMARLDELNAMAAEFNVKERLIQKKVGKIATNQVQSRILIERGIPVSTADMRIDYGPKSFGAEKEQSVSPCVFHGKEVGGYAWSVTRLLSLIRQDNSFNLISVKPRSFVFSLQYHCEIEGDHTRKEGVQDSSDTAYRMESSVSKSSAAEVICNVFNRILESPNKSQVERCFDFTHISLCGCTSFDISRRLSLTNLYVGTADMCYTIGSTSRHGMYFQENVLRPDHEPWSHTCVPAWSLTALLDLFLQYKSTILCNAIYGFQFAITVEYNETLALRCEDAGGFVINKSKSEITLLTLGATPSEAVGYAVLMILEVDKDGEILPQVLPCEIAIPT
jgi:hypothetical protein